MQQRNAKKEFKVQVSELLMTTPTILSHPDPLLANSLQDTTAGLGYITLCTTNKDPQHSMPNLHEFFLDLCNIALDLHDTTLGLQHPMKGNTSDLQTTSFVHTQLSFANCALRISQLVDSIGQTRILKKRNGEG